MSPHIPTATRPPGERVDLFRQATEEPDSGTELAAAIRLLDLENRRMRADMARTVGLSENEFSALIHVSEVEQSTPKVLVQELGLTTGAVTAMIDRLEAAKLLERRPHATDRRSTVLGLTPRGEAARDWIFGSYLRAIEAAAASAGDAKTRAAVEILYNAATHVRVATANLEHRIPGE